MAKLSKKVLDFPKNYPVVLILVTTIIYSFLFRWSFLESFDPQYMREYYYASQWRIPHSQRVMGDNELFPYGGYELINGADPFDVNPETPPLGKYLLGLSIKLFGSPSVLNVPLFFITALLFLNISKFLIKEKSRQLLALTLFLLSPMVASQIPLRLLELPQLTVFLGHILLLFLLISSKSKSRNNIYSILAGVLLGAFVGIKPGAFVFAILLADVLVLVQSKKLFQIIPIVIFSGLTYLAIYLQYFLLGHSLQEWLSSQIWIAHFHLDSGLKANPLDVISTISLGLFKGWWEEANWHFINEWSALWLLGLGALIYSLFKKIRGQKFTIFDNFVIFVCLGLLATNLAIPFWPRYLILLGPLFTILIVKLLPKKEPIVIVLLVVMLLFQAALVTLPENKFLTSEIQRTWNQGYYQDLYSLLDKNTQNSISREEFSNRIKTFFLESGVEKTNVMLSVTANLPWKPKLESKLRLTYITPFSLWWSEKQITFVNENNHWRLKWDFSYLTPKAYTTAVKTP